jgi:hypothetical protein
MPPQAENRMACLRPSISAFFRFRTLLGALILANLVKVLPQLSNSLLQSNWIKNIYHQH